MMQLIDLSRHAETYQNIRSTIGNPYDITPNGIEQAKILGRYLKANRPIHDLVYLVSGEQRTHITMDIVTQEAGVKLNQDVNYFLLPEFNEISTLSFNEKSPIAIKLNEQFRSVCNRFFPRPLFTVFHGIVNYTLMRTYSDNLEQAVMQSDHNCGIHKLQYDGKNIRMTEEFLPNWALEYMS